MADYLHPDSIENKLGLGRVPSESQEGVLWRGMSGGEYKNFLEQGFLESRGEYNIGDAQKNLTIFSSDPRKAEMYAHDFAPRDFKASPESSAYVVGIKKPSDAVPQQFGGAGEFGVRGQTPTENVVKVYRGNVFRPKSERAPAVLDWQEVPVSDLREPRTVDRSKLPAVIDAASAATGIARLGANEPRPKGKGEVFRGIGSLARRRVFPLVRLAQEGYGMLSDEQKDELQEFLARPAHELVGMEKPGIEYVRDWLGMEQPSPTESPDRKSQAPKTTQEKLDDFFLNMGEDGVGTEYPDVYRGIERYVMNADRKGLSDALSSESYPEYRRVMQFNLRSMFPDGSIPVKRVEGYGQGPGVDRKTKRFNVSPEDVVFVGGESEYELIIKGAKYGYDRPVSVRITPEAPDRKASGGFVDKPLYNDARIGGMI